jgi:hypothetical protein
MHCVAAEIAQEVRVFLQNQDFDPGSRKQVSEHYSGWAAPAMQHVLRDGESINSISFTRAQPSQFNLSPLVVGDIGRAGYKRSQAVQKRRDT